MNENKTSSMLQRLPLILAVTAASYGLNVQAQSSPRAERSGAPRHASAALSGTTTASVLERMREDLAAQD